MEGRVYRCSWRRAGERFEVWVRSNRRLWAEGTSFREASEALWGEIVRAKGDGEALLEYDPPEPVEASLRRYLDPPIVTAVGNMRAILANAGEVYSEGICAGCKKPRGERTAATALVEDIESGYEGGFTHPGRIVFFTEKFLALLTDEERGRFEWRPLRRGGRGHIAFHEMIARPDVPLVAVKGLAFKSWVCDTCGQPFPPRCFQPDLHLHEFVCRTDLPRPLPGCFTFGLGHDVSLAFPQERWRGMGGRAGTRGIATNDVGVVDERDCVRPVA